MWVLITTQLIKCLLTSVFKLEIKTTAVNFALTLPVPHTPLWVVNCVVCVGREEGGKVHSSSLNFTGPITPRPSHFPWGVRERRKGSENQSNTINLTHRHENVVRPCVCASRAGSDLLIADTGVWGSGDEGRLPGIRVESSQDTQARSLNTHLWLPITHSCPAITISFCQWRLNQPCWVQCVSWERQPLLTQLILHTLITEGER